MNNGTKSNTAIVVISIASVLVSGLIGYMIGGSMGDDQKSHDTSSNLQPSTTTKAADVRVALNNALREHVSLGAAALRAAFDGDPNIEALLGTLDENSVEVAGLVGSVYGSDAQEAFLQLWRNHIGFFADYTVAAKSGDSDGMQQALDDLAGYSQDAGAFFENANPNLPASAVVPLLKEHRDLVIAAVNAWGAKDYSESYTQEQMARDQVGQIADALSKGIVAQAPDKF